MIVSVWPHMLANHDLVIIGSSTHTGSNSILLVIFGLANERTKDEIEEILHLLLLFHHPAYLCIAARVRS